MTQYPDPNSPAGHTRSRSPALLVALVIGVLVVVGSGVTFMLMMQEKPPLVPATQPGQEIKPVPVVLEGPALEVDAAEMINLFRDKPEEAEAMYKGKVLDVTGTVSGKLDNNFAGERALALEGGVQRFAGVRCVLPEPNYFQMNEVEVGNKVTVRGRCESLVSDAILRNCAVLKIHE